MVLEESALWKLLEVVMFGHSLLDCGWNGTGCLALLAGGSESHIFKNILPAWELEKICLGTT